MSGAVGGKGIGKMTTKQANAKHKPFGIQLQAHQVVVRPLLTEKGIHRASRNNQYAFEVHPNATKDDVRSAIEELFNVKVTRVATQNKHGKSRRFRNRVTPARPWKKAIVTLHSEHRLDFF